MLAAHAQVGIFLADAAGNTLYANRHCCELTGLSPAQVTGSGWASALHPADRDRVLQAWQEAVRSDSPFAEEYRFLSPRNGGECVWVSGNARRVQDDTGALSGYLGTVADITERKAVELALKEANQRMQSVLDASPLAILSIDARGCIMGWNQGAERKFGWGAAEVMGRVCPRVPAQGLDDFHDMIRRVMAGEPWRGQVRNRRRKNGGLIRASISAAPLLDAVGKRIGIVAILEDVTERERAQERLRQLLEERERIVLDLHDGCIQSVFSIGLNLEACRGLIREDPGTASTKVADAIADLNLVIHDLRLFILGDQREIASGAELTAALERSVEMMGNREPVFSVSIDASAADKLTPDQALHLLQIARAALSNAVRHGRAHTGTLALRRSGGNIVLEISDDGAGFDSEQVEQPGLGLRGIEARARKLGGRYRVSSAAGGGTRIVVEIPIAQAP